MKFDLHVHSFHSIDSKSTLDDICNAAKRAGLSGVAICDHNTFVLPLLREDIILIPACEYSTNAGHMLTYFLKEPLESKLSKNELGQYSWREVIDAAHEQGAIVFLAHPYAPMLRRPQELWKHIDGIEVFNSRIEHSRIKDANLNAQTTCLLLGKPFSAGSDGHFPGEIGSSFWETSLNSTGKTQDELLLEIKENLLNKSGKAFGSAASPLYRPMSQWIKMCRQKNPSRIPKIIAHLGIAALKSIGRRFGIDKKHHGYLDFP